jgi:hypothetical protein
VPLCERWPPLTWCIGLAGGAMLWRAAPEVARRLRLRGPSSMTKPGAAVILAKGNLSGE